LAVVSTQAPLHRVSVPGHPHVPPTQAAPVPHALPHVPQLAGSWAVSAHTVPQRVKDAEQAHAPFEHDVPVGQAVPQAPQFAGSLVRSAQDALPPVLPPVPALGVHRVGFAGGHPHAPAEQITPSPQTLPQAPQLLTSLWRSAQ
jgi:hypothetical protein